MKLKNKKMNRIYVWLIIAAMLSGMLPTSVLAVPLPEAQPDGLDNYVVELSADPSTSARPSTFGTASDDGRVWTDKSVSVNGTKFDVTLSALAQEFVRTSTNEVREQAAADVAMVLDMSGSMTADRVTRMKDAVNKGIDIIMATNPRNRIGVYYYGLAANAGTLFPLASYSTSATGDGSDAVNRYLTSSGQTITRVAGLTQKYLDVVGEPGTTSSQSISTSNATATQAGLYTAITALKTDIASRLPNSIDTERVPYVLLLTDGEANRANINWYNSPPNGTERAGSGASGTAEISALTILTAAKLKEELKQAYSLHSGGKDVVWFNVAFGLTEDNNLATALLKPDLLASDLRSNLVSVYSQLNTLTNSASEAYEKYGIGGTPGYLYAQDYIYFVSPSDLSKVDEALEDLAALVEAATQEKIIPFEQVNEFGIPLNLLVTDVLGTGIELKTAPKMGTVTGTVKSNSGSVTTYEFSGLGTTVEYDSATREVKWIILPAEVPLIMFSDRQVPTPGEYSNSGLLPVQLTYTVGLIDTYESGTLYSNEYTNAATATARFIPMAENPYYYKDIVEVDDKIESNRKVIGSDITASELKSPNTTGTAEDIYEYEWVVEGPDNVFVTKLGNNGKIAPKLKIEKNPASGSVLAGDNAIYHITVTNQTGSNMSDIIVNDVLPSGLTFVAGSITENSTSKPTATFPYTISTVSANGSVELTFQATVPSAATEGTEYTNSATITSVDGTLLNTPATVTSDKVTVADTLSPSVTVKLDGAGYTGLTVELWKDGAKQYTLTGSGGIYTASGVTPGTYDIYVNDVNTEVQLSSSDANKEINYYSVSFYDGAQKYITPAAQIILSGGKAVLPTAPTKVGYTFDEWVTTEGGTTAYDFDAVITSTTNIYATWTAKADTAYKVKHYQAAVDGSYPATPTLVEDLTGTTGSTTSAAAQTYTGFTAVAFSQGTIAADGSTVVEIRYVRDLYDITFVIDSSKGTTTDDTTSEVRYGATPTAPDITDKPGYELTGWDKTIIPATGNETYTAEFDLIDFTISYDLAGGSVAVANPETYTVESTDITLNNPTRQGYIFDGWTGTDPTTTVTIAQGSTGDRDYVANWTIITTSVTLDVYGGSGGTRSVIATYGEPMPGATAPTQAGYTFVGYYDQPGGGTKYYNADMSSAKDWDKTESSVTLYAVWTELGNVTIEYVSNDTNYGTVSLPYESLNPETGTATGSVATAKLGHHFIEWQNASGAQVSTSDSYVPLKDSGSYEAAIYTAIFEADTSSVTLDDNGGSGGSGSVTTATYGQPMPAATEPSRPGYAFTGYYDQTSGGTKYYNADMSSAKAWDKTDTTVTLYAVWTELGNVTIQYVSNNTAYGTVSPTDESLNPETGTATGSVATANIGYHLVEWQNANGDVVSTGDTYVPQKDSGSYVAATYTAIFAANNNLDGWSGQFTYDQLTRLVDPISWTIPTYGLVDSVFLKAVSAIHVQKVMAETVVDVENSEGTPGMETLTAELQLVNGLTYSTDGYKLWAGTTRLPVGVKVINDTYEVVFTALDGNDTVIEEDSVNEDIAVAANNPFAVETSLTIRGTVTKSLPSNHEDYPFPIDEALVQLYDPVTNQLVAATTTDVDGKYEFVDVDVANYKLVVSKNTYSNSTQVFYALPEFGTNEVIVDAQLSPYQITLFADPTSLLGDGISETILTAIITDLDGGPLPGVTANFESPSGKGTFPGGKIAVTDANGMAKVTLKSDVVGGTSSVWFPVILEVSDSVHELYANTQINITFEPGAIVGVVTEMVDVNGNKTKVNVEGAIIEVSNDVIDFYARYVTRADGAYAIGVPVGNIEYQVTITKPVMIDGVRQLISFPQTAHVGAIPGDVFKEHPVEKAGSGLVLMKTPAGETAKFDVNIYQKMDVYLIDPANPLVRIPVDMNDDGTFNKQGLDVKEYKFYVTLKDNGDTLVISSGVLSIQKDGEMNITTELVDPYGDVRNINTNGLIVGAKVKLFYTDTKLPVTLPLLAGFDPFNNLSPEQITDARGLYAWMVYPETDYYIVATAPGYYEYKSPNIRVDWDIVRHDIRMTPLPTPGFFPPSLPLVEDKESTGTDIDLAVDISVNQRSFMEGSKIELTVDFLNRSTVSATDVVVTLDLPINTIVIDPDGGELSEDGTQIIWTIEQLSGGKYEQRIVKLQAGEIDSSEQELDSQAIITSRDKLINLKDDVSKLKIMLFSNDYGVFTHNRYIVGYPDGEFKPDKNITRAEIANIFARILKLRGYVEGKVIYSDVPQGQWYADGIEAVTNRGLFSGYNDGTFRPNQPITRAELAIVIGKFLELEDRPPVVIGFKDLTGHWAANIIENVRRNRVSTGYVDGSFKPNNQLVRSEAVIMINRMLYRGPLIGVDPSYLDVMAVDWEHGDVEESTRSHEATRNLDSSEQFIREIETGLGF